MAKGLDKIRNYVYNTICEYLIEEHPKRFKMYSTFRIFCGVMRSSIMQKDLNSKELTLIYDVFLLLKKIYGFNDSESAMYLIEFFDLKKYEVFEEPVRAIRIVFPEAY